MIRWLQAAVWKEHHTVLCIWAHAPSTWTTPTLTLLYIALMASPACEALQHEVTLVCIFLWVAVPGSLFKEPSKRTESIKSKDMPGTPGGCHLCHLQYTSTMNSEHLDHEQWKSGLQLGSVISYTNPSPSVSRWYRWYPDIFLIP